MSDIELNTILNIKAEEGLTYLNDESIDLVITSPPYDNIRNYNNDNKSQENNSHFDIDIIVNELYRVLKKGGVVIWVVADQTDKASESTTSFHQAIKFNKKGFKLYDTMIFEKQNPIPQTHKRYEQSFEYMFMFAKGKPKTSNIIVEKSKYSGKKRCKHTYRHDENDKLSPQHKGGEVSEYKIRNNIFKYIVGKSEKYRDIVKRDHPARFPMELVRDQLLSWSNEGDIVLDPFSGSGTTAIVAMLTNRNYIGFEKNYKYTEDSNRYINIVKDKINKDDKSIKAFNTDVSNMIYKEFN